MICTILDIEDLDDVDAFYIARHLCKPGSVFAGELADGTTTGVIALVRDHGEIVGWARTTDWIEEDCDASHRLYHLPPHWATLEAFVATDWRYRGVATFAVAGLKAAGAFVEPDVAVFAPQMLILARDARLMPKLFRKEGDSWVRA